MQSCAHCDEEVFSPIYDSKDHIYQHPFCCHGCLTVYNILHQKGLDQYYEIKNDASFFKRRSPVEISKINYDYLDQKEFLAEYSHTDHFGHVVMEFYLEGLHCLACLWLIEKLHEIIPGVESLRVNLEKSTLTVVIHNGASFSLVAQELNRLGYRSHPLKNNLVQEGLKRQEEKSQLLRIGVAGAATGNIMMYAISIYGGAKNEFAQLFNSITVLLAYPVLIYSAFPFYLNAWNSLKNKSISVDVPISLALLMGGIMGTYNWFMGVHENYFDSLTALVFLLLLSRYFLQKIQERGLSTNDLFFNYQGESVLKWDDKEMSFVAIHPKYLKIDDIVKIAPHELFPVDGVVLRGKTHVNNSLLTGEVMPVRVGHGDKIFAGTQNLDEEIEVKATSTFSNSRVGEILKSVERGWSLKSNIFELSQKISSYFIAAVILLSFGVFVFYYFQGDLINGIELALTLLIVTCPCALAIAIPLTFTKALTQAANNGIIIKNNAVLEKILKVKNIFFDKTGTLTYGRPEVQALDSLKKSVIPVSNIILTLEEKSQHPVAKALVEWAMKNEGKVLKVENFKEVVGRGVSGVIDGVNFEINRAGIWENKNLIATFTISDRLRNDAKTVFEKIYNTNRRPFILSGDTFEQVSKISHDLNLSDVSIFSQISPEEKVTTIKNHKPCMMIGDGANDAMALTEANVGVAVRGALPLSLKAADIILTNPGIDDIPKILDLSQEVMKVIYRNFTLSIIYNTVSVIAVFAGVINPLIAAVIMPLSSLTVLFSTIWGTKRWRSLWK